MARPSAALVVAEGAAPSSKGFASSYPRLSYARDFCLRLLATPTTVMLREAHGVLLELIGLASACIVKALSPRLCLKSRKRNLTDSQLAMGTLLGLVDAILRVPPRILQQRWPDGLGVCATLTYVVNTLVDVSLAHDRAAAELDMEPYDGGPFAVPALPQGRPLLGGAR